MKLTEILAIYAAVLSTIVFVWNIRRAIPRFKVEIIFGTDEVDGELVVGAYISVKNPSSHTVHLSNISLLYPYRKSGLYERIKHLLKYRRFPFAAGWVHSSLSNYGIDDKCPVSLEPGKSVGIFVPEDVLEKVFEECEERSIKASAQDELWRNKYSGKFEYPEVDRRES
ncbi:hypothetical protein CEK62_20220 (plasmid) [Alcanivorax sp. N3-2A]|nr:hypothetical protein CEK62_00030 [Alcanivorax sp. N3-2A]ASK36696.1 hypothetical protein CEK62_20220 [Alcanivorax sp. N3-2A]